MIGETTLLFWRPTLPTQGRDSLPAPLPLQYLVLGTERFCGRFSTTIRGCLMPQTSSSIHFANSRSLVAPIIDTTVPARTMTLSHLDVMDFSLGHNANTQNRRSSTKCNSRLPGAAKLGPIKQAPHKSITWSLN